MSNGKPFFEKKAVKIIKRVIMIAFWAVLIGFCIYYHDEITVENIVSHVPKNSAISIIVMLLLYGLKGLAVFVYGGILYAAGGILFSLPVAIIVGTLGTAIMISVPFFIGKKAGAHSVEALMNRNKKLEILLDMQSKNEIWVSFFIRMIGLLPADIVAMYLGASGMKYKNYFLGSMVGLFPSVLCIDYKDAAKLKRYLTEAGKIIPRRVTGNCAKHQRMIAKAVKQAREAAIIGYVFD